MTEKNLRPALPKWFWPVAVAGLAWNVFGVVQWLSKIQSTVDGLMRTGLTKEQAQLYASLPLWMDLSFGIGVMGGTIGCIMLMLRIQAATVVFALSLAAYIALYIGDISYGVFAAFGASQVVVLTLVVAIAGALQWVSLRQRKLLAA
jgi:hypothetical protein